MRYLILVVGFIIVGNLTLSNEARASHSVGADLTYECLGGNQYLIKLAFYRDCAGIAAPVQPQVTVSSTNCGFSQVLNMDSILINGTEVTPICPTENSTCSGGNFSGIEEYVYVTIFTLPMNCTDWTFSYFVCNRNSTISTINLPNTECIYVESTLNNLTAPCNSSPSFTNKPVSFICMNDQYCFNHGAIDTDGDSLVYSLITPKSYFNQQVRDVVYSGGYSETQPLTSSPPVSFKTATGDICMTPQALEITVLAVLVEEYRNGQKIGSVIRDIQLNIISCTNTNPYLDGMNGSQACAQTVPSTCRFDTTICGAFTFTINGYDDDAPAQNLTMSWNEAIPGATFTATSGTNPVGTFSWTPTQADVSTIPHCFTVEIKDDNCPYVGSNVYAFCITVSDFVEVSTNVTDTVDIVCGEDTLVVATANGGSGIYTYQWSNNFNEGDSTLLELEQTYTVEATDSKGCSATDTVTLNFIYPTADFTADSNCAGSGINFTDQSTGPNGLAIITWQWSFDDGGTAFTPNPNHVFTNEGVHNATLIASTSFGCNDTITKQVLAWPKPQPAISTANRCEFDSTQFTDASTITSGTVDSWLWVFGDGITSTQQNPIHAYSGDSCWDVTLIVNSDLGCTDILIETLCINSKPQANFTPDSGCFPLAIDFLSTSTIDSGSITGYKWYFTPNDSSNVSDPDFTFTAEGVYNVTLIITSDSGCMDTLTKTVTLLPEAKGSYSYTNACAEDSTYFTFTDSTNTDSIVQWLWVYGDGDSSTTENPGHVYTTGGPYSVTLYATTNNGCIDTITNSVTVNPIPTIDFTPKQVCHNQPNQFKDLATISSGKIISWLWDFGDGNTSNDSTPTHTYATEGDYNVVLHLTTDSGCVDSLRQRVGVFPIPTVTFNVDSFGCEPIPVTIASSSTVSSGSIVDWTWDIGLGDTTIVGDSVLNFVFENDEIDIAKYHDIKLTVTSDAGCKDSIRVDSAIQVYPTPTVAFSCNPETADLLNAFVQFEDESIGCTAWLWDFGDSTTSLIQNPPHVYLSEGTYTVQLIGNNAFGCPDTVSKQITIHPVFTFFAPNAFSPEGDKINDTFSPYGVGYTEIEMWIYTRWGEKIYYSSDFTGNPPIPWDGTFKGNNAKEDVYVYMIKLKTVFGATKTFTGHVALIR